MSSAFDGTPARKLTVSRALLATQREELRQDIVRDMDALAEYVAAHGNPATERRAMNEAAGVLASDIRGSNTFRQDDLPFATTDASVIPTRR